MSISAIRHQPLFQSEQPFFEVAQSNINTLKDWSYLIPTISVLALGIISTANIPVGMVIGVVSFALGAAAAIATSLLGLSEEDRDSEYEKMLSDNPLLATLAAPFLEEGFFRGFLQPLVMRSIVILVPAAAAAFLGTSFTIASTVSIVATAALFGIAHIFNDHKNSHIQAALATVGGVLYGITAAQFGLPAAIAAHIINNTLAMTMMKMSKQETPRISQVGSPV